MKKHRITGILPDSIALECGINTGDYLISIDNNSIEDIFDYQFLVQSEELSLITEDPSGEQYLFEIEKDEDEDLGFIFEDGLMDDYRSCKNKCIFCFIDQMPRGMRETLYFKDDDSRLSFLQGNYITLTGLSEKDVERIIKYNLSPINISFHTMDPDLRCKMLNNRFAGESLKLVERFYEAGIEMNGQIVLCRGINDGDKLDESIEKLSDYIPVLRSLSVVPVGLTKFREGLYPLEPFDTVTAGIVLDKIEGWQKRINHKYGINFVHPGDEWYMMAGREFPPADSYDGYLQLENGVGMVRLFMDEFYEALEELKGSRTQSPGRTVSLATGKLMYPYIKRFTEDCCNIISGLTARVYLISNDFFGPLITVSGLLTGKDIISQLKGKELGEELLLPENILRAGENVLLDDITIDDIERGLKVRVVIVKESGREFLNCLLGGTTDTKNTKNTPGV